MEGRPQVRDRRQLHIAGAFVLASVFAVACGAGPSTDPTAGGSEDEVKSAESCESVKDCSANASLGATCTDEVPENCNVECVYAAGAARGTCGKPGTAAADAGAAADAHAPERCDSVLDCAANEAQNKKHRGSCTDEVPENCMQSCDDGVCTNN